VARHAGNRARQQWDAARATLNEGETVVPYLQRKRLRWEKGLRVYRDGTLLVPMIRYDVTEEQEKDPRTRARAPRWPAEDPAGRLRQALQPWNGEGRRCVPLRPKPKDGELC
jgi:hypothetical protein